MIAREHPVRPTVALSRHRAVLFMLTLGAVAVVGVGCRGGGGGEEPGAAQPGADIPFPVEEADQATIRGVVHFEGTAPEPAKIDMSGELTCAEKHAEGAFTEEVVTSDGALANVFVYVKDGPHGELQFPVPSEGVLLDQDGCQYKPHVFGFQTNQAWIIRNSDGILHNIHPRPKENRAFNVGQPRNMDTKKSFSKPELGIPIGCEVHEWMSAYVHVLEHPYFATSDAEGAFEITRLPPGDYTLEAWHEVFGTQEAKVTVEAGGTGEVEFTFSP
jgi:hypothetical protein